MKFLQKLQDVFNASRPRWRIRPRPTPTAPVVPTAVNNSAPITYVINDMSTPLTKVITPLPAATPAYMVKDYEGGGFALGTKQSRSANVYTTITNVLNYHRQVVPNFINGWALPPFLRILPEAGVDLNAFYDRKSLQFFFYGRHEIGGTLYTADSADIVAHELGHAILDAYRPEAFSAASLEVWAMHEAFADWTAVTNILSHDEAIQHILTQTGGNLRLPNLATNLAEHVGKAIHILTGDTNRDPNCLRSAINTFNYVDPGALPEKAPYNQLAGECHSFGRLFLGVFYDILVEIYEGELTKSQDPAKALKDATAGVAQRVGLAMQNAPMNVKFSESVGKTLLWLENTRFGNTYYDKINAILSARKIISPGIKMLGVSRCENEERIMRVPNTVRVRLGDHLFRAQADNPLYDVEVEIPNEQVYFYDRDKNLMDTALVSEEQSMEGGQTMIEFLHRANLVGDDLSTPFEISDGKLVRTRFS